MKVKIGSFENFLERLNNIKEEDIIINDENTEEMFSSFLITFYKENEGRYTIQEQEYINNLLNILINKIRDNKNGRNFFSNLLCIHFKSITPYFINVKLKDNIYYIHLLINYILYVLNLVIYIEKENKELSLSLSIGRNIYTLTLYIIKNIKQNRYDNFYLKIIEEGKLIYLLCKICYDKFIISYYIPEDNVVELFFVLIKIKELEKYIIECDIIKYFLSFLLYDPQVIKKRKHLIIEIIIHMFLKNISIIKDFIKQNIIDILNNILKSIYNNIKCDHYDYYCINLLKIFYYIIQDKNIVNLENNFFSYPKNTSYIIEHEKNNNILIFYKYINNIINKINDVIKQNMSCKDSANIHILNNNDQLNYHFKYFLSILLCVIKSIITRIFQGKNNIQDSPSDDDKREEVYEEIIKLVNVTFEFVVNIIDKQKETSPDEEEIYELISYDMLICMTKINSLKYNFFEYFKGKLFDFLDCITHDEIIQNKYNDKIVIYSKNGLLDDNNINRDKINYLCNNNKNVLSFVNKTYVKNFECLFYLCLYNEKNRIHNISINLIRNIENNIFTIYKYIHICNINTKELLNSLSLYYLVIIFIYIKNNLYNKEKIHLLKSFIQFLIIKEIKERIFLFKNELYFLAFIKILNLSICNNLFDFKILLCEKYFDDFIRILEESKLSMQEQILYFILEWTQIHPILKKLQIYISKNKLIFHVLFKIWKDIEYDNKLKNIKVQPEEINVMYRNNNQNVQFILFRIIKMLTKNFTQYIDYIINNKDLFSTYKNIIIYESKTILTIYEQIRDDMNEEHVLLHREEENLLLKFVNLYKEDIKKFERIFENVATFYNKKDNMELQNYYDYLRENKGIE
ncbi:hypothetical protein PFNF135_03724 [Plasmodium falciparum NF135/5.C10]|uniref:Uncharacterized protein n=1 Tax=Plasmodium falciparum NF135/5.C10 TaxID=1036726 RepID=W4IFQ6_PLAFA|nr:hypothetical protein PFNF135_03724 [Plasmodium falciparum NF135/5.C10]